MKASDIMVTKVITVEPNTSIKEVANVLLTHRISAVPVVGGEGVLRGIVSEGDLVRRVEIGTDRRRSWWLQLFVSNPTLAAEFVKSHGTKAGDVMTREVITATPETSITKIAALLEGNHIKRVPIVKDGKIVGLVSRANLLQALASPSIRGADSPRARDAELRRSVLDRLNAEPWYPSLLNVTVHDGTVNLWGLVRSNDERRAVRIAVETTPGVKLVNNNLMIPPPEAGWA